MLSRRWTLLAPHARAGVYVAWHPWLDAVRRATVGEDNDGVQLVKVGSSTDFARRLTDTSYTTCFPPGWKYVLTYEVTAGASSQPADVNRLAQQLESAVLHCVASRRLHNRELVLMPLDELGVLIPAVAKALGVPGVCRVNPHYDGTNEEEEGSLDGNNAKPTRQPLLSLDQLEVLAPYRVKATTLTDVRDVALGVSSSYRDHQQQAAGHTAKSVGGGRRPKPSSDDPPTLSPTARLALAKHDDAVNQSKLASSPQPRVLTAPQVTAKAGAVSYQLRAYQAEAVQAALAEVHRCGRALLHIACRCGKTPIAHALVRHVLTTSRERESSATRQVLVLVPNRPLLRQTVEKLCSYGGLDCDVLAVGTSHTADLTLDGEALASTTNSSVIEAFFKRCKSQGRHALVVSTYHSSELLPLLSFDLTICDEAHRTCVDRESTFNAVLRAAKAKAERHNIVFMTATPQWDSVDETALSMRDESVFGGVAYRYPLSRGITEGVVNDYALVFVAVRREEAEAEDRATARGIAFAMSHGHHPTMLVYCRSLQQMDNLLQYLRHDPALSTHGVEVLAVGSNMSTANVVATMKNFVTASHSRRAVLLSCRMVQEGFDMPTLGAVFFAAPRASQRDIIQSMCRPLNANPGKPASVVYALVTLPQQGDDDVQMVAEAAVPLGDAVMVEDERLFRSLVSTDDAVTFPMRVIIASCAAQGLTPQELSATQDRLLQTIRFTMSHGGSKPTNRLLSPASLPWHATFSQLKAFVERSGVYPEADDASATWQVGGTVLHLEPFFQWCRVAYLNHVQRRRSSDGAVASLKTYQARMLETLPAWPSVAKTGSSAGTTAIGSLRSYLAASKGVAPPLLVHDMAYRGADSTPLEDVCYGLSRATSGQAKAERLYLGVVKEFGSWETLQSFVSDCADRAATLQARNDSAWRAFLRENFPGYPEKQVLRRRVAALRQLLENNASQEPSPSVDRPSKKPDAAPATRHCQVCDKHVDVFNFDAHQASAGHARRVAVIRKYLHDLQSGERQHSAHLDLSQGKRTDDGAAAVGADFDVNWLFKAVRCTLCDVALGDVEQFLVHCEGAKHQKAEAARKNTTDTTKPPPQQGTGVKESDAKVDQAAGISTKSVVAPPPRPSKSSFRMCLVCAAGPYSPIDMVLHEETALHKEAVDRRALLDALPTLEATQVERALSRPRKSFLMAKKETQDTLRTS